jgi:hypothetical protein
MTMVTPKNRAKTTSRTRPRILDTSVIALTTEVDRSRRLPLIGRFDVGAVACGGLSGACSEGMAGASLSLDAARNP